MDLAQLAKGVANVPLKDPPPELNATLRSYQQEGFSWMAFLADRGLGGVLADDMGLGKTVQSLAFVQHRQHEDPGVQLVVAPRSVVDNWAEEAKKFLPSMPIYVHLGLDRTKELDDLPSEGILLTSFNILQRDIALLVQIEYSTIILDEAHVIRNPEAKTTRAALKLNGRRRVCLSGTPVQNCAEDLWPIFHFLMPGFLGRRKTLRETLSEDRKAVERSTRTRRAICFAALEERSGDLSCRRKLRSCCMPRCRTSKSVSIANWKKKSVRASCRCLIPMVLNGHGCLFWRRLLACDRRHVTRPWLGRLRLSRRKLNCLWIWLMN